MTTNYVGYEAKNGLVALAKSIMSKDLSEIALDDFEAMKLAFMGAGLDYYAAEAAAWTIYFASRKLAADRLTFADLVVSH